jgi:hypothetical protein
VRITAQQIEDWVSRHFKYKRKSKGRQLCINNPFDASDNDFHFWISTQETVSKRSKKKDFWCHDFRPGMEKHNSSFLTFVRAYKNITRFQAMQEITGKSKDELRQVMQNVRNLGVVDEEEEEKIIAELELPKLALPFTDTSREKVRQLALNYLKSRKVTEEEAIKLSLYYTPTTIVFPYIEYGAMVYWQERDILEKKFNFPNEEATGLGKTDFLYNFDNIEPNGQLITVESIFNCISVGDDCGATGGATIAGRQLLKFRALNPEVIILGPDNDKAGVESLRKNYFELKDQYKLAYSLPKDGIKDWNDMDKIFGKGAARAWINDHCYSLNLPVIMKLLSKYS